MEEKEQSHVGRMDFERDILDKAVETGKGVDRSRIGSKHNRFHDAFV